MYVCMYVCMMYVCLSAVANSLQYECVYQVTDDYPPHSDSTNVIFKSGDKIIQVCIVVLSVCLLCLSVCLLCVVCLFVVCCLSRVGSVCLCTSQTSLIQAPWD